MHRKFRSKRKWNGSAQVEIFRSKWSSLTGRSSPTENCRSIFKNFRFQSRSSSSLHIVVKMADGSDGSVYSDRLVRYNGEPPRSYFLKLDREFFCLFPSLAGLYSAPASQSSRLRSNGSLASTLMRFHLKTYTFSMPRLRPYVHTHTGIR